MSVAEDRLAAVAERHGLSRGAVLALAEAIDRRPGGGAQWDHPDLGGMGQWLGGGMLQIGAMFDAELKGRVAAALADLVPPVASGSRRSAPDGGPDVATWWPAGLGSPTASGSQNAMRYACFPAARRLVVERDGQVTVYDAGAHRLTGVSQAQAGDAQTLAFSGPDGTLRLEELTPIVA